jgi:hypothetical protein
VPYGRRRSDSSSSDSDDDSYSNSQDAVDVTAGRQEENNRSADKSDVGTRELQTQETDNGIHAIVCHVIADYAARAGCEAIVVLSCQSMFSVVDP